MARMECCRMCERKKLIALIDAGVGVAETARQLGVSRKTAYKWLERYKESGGREESLRDRSRARHDTGRLEGALVKELVTLRKRRPSWGPRKIRAALRRERPEEEWPSASTIGALLKREGLVAPRQRRTRHVAFRYAGPPPTEPNERWTIDFKGDFLLGNGSKCLPLTLRDAASRYLLGISAMTSTHGVLVRQYLTHCFREAGLPRELQSDSGPPFATTGIARLSALSVWLMKLDVCPVLSRPGHPQDNGAHERMHRDLKAETTRPPCLTSAAQQRRFNQWLQDFNKTRPHEALNGAVPAERWHPSTRPYCETISSWDYPRWWSVRRVNRACPAFSWRSQAIRINDALAGEDLGFEEIEDGLWRICFRRFALGLLDERRSSPMILTLARTGGRLHQTT